MTDPDIDWSITTWEGNRLHQHREFYALPFRRKLEIIEGLCEVATAFSSRANQAPGELPTRDEMGSEGDQ